MCTLMTTFMIVHSLISAVILYVGNSQVSDPFKSPAPPFSEVSFLETFR